MKKLASLISIIALLILCIPVMGQDATLEATVDVAPVTVVDGQGEGDTIVNVGGETPVDETPETPTEAMPWWAQAGLTIAGLATFYVTLTTVVREAVKAFMARPDSVASAENAVNLIRSLLPDIIEEAAAKGAKQAEAATRETMEELRKAFTALTDGVAESSKKTSPAASSLSGTTGGYTVSSTPGVAPSGDVSGFSG